VLKRGSAASADELRAFLSEQFAKWQMPDEFVFTHELPHTSTGKLLKTKLRERYREFTAQTRDS
jgi:fatty-acyl-CoA synthase